MQYSTKKSSVAEIRHRFDADVERFSNLRTGQAATMDAPLAMELIVQAAAANNRSAKSILDVGCGAGNFTLKLLEYLGDSVEHITLVDLSQLMLKQAQKRIAAIFSGTITLQQKDIRRVELGRHRQDIIIAAAVLHHLRTKDQWQRVFKKLFEALKPGGSLWISDLITHELPAVHGIMQNRYGEFLAKSGGKPYRDKVFDYIAREDTPRPVTFQMDLLRKVGFSKIELLHKNSVFATFGAVK